MDCQLPPDSQSPHDCLSPQDGLSHNDIMSPCDSLSPKSAPSNVVKIWNLCCIEYSTDILLIVVGFCELKINYDCIVDNLMDSLFELK